MAFTQIEAAGITSTSTVVFNNTTVTGVITAIGGFSGNVTGTHIGDVVASSITVTTVKHPSSSSSNIVLDSSGNVQSPSLVPPGVVQFYASSTLPIGWIKANGAAISRTTYINLFTAIGITFGAGDGSTTFNLPDLRGEFIRGWDDSRGVDTGRAFGDAQSGTIQSHSHTTGVNIKNTSGWDGAFGAYFGTGGNYGQANTGTAGGTETRPRNIALLAIIKY